MTDPVPEAAQAAVADATIPPLPPSGEHVAPDDNADLVLGDDQGADQVARADQGRPPLEVSEGIIPEDQRDIPPTVDPAIGHQTLASHIYVEATVNLPGWNLWAEEVQEVSEGGTVLQPAHHRVGWIPNNEEGVHAVELGWAKLIDAPDGEEPPAPPATRNPYAGL